MEALRIAWDTGIYQVYGLILAMFLGSGVKSRNYWKVTECSFVFICWSLPHSITNEQLFVATRCSRGSLPTCCSLYIAAQGLFCRGGIAPTVSLRGPSAGERKYTTMADLFINTCYTIDINSCYTDCRRVARNLIEQYE